MRGADLHKSQMASDTPSSTAFKPGTADAGASHAANRSAGITTVPTVRRSGFGALAVEGGHGAHVAGRGESGKRNRRVLVVAAYRESIDRWTEACREANIELVGIDLEAFALLRAVAPPVDPESAAARVAGTIGHERTTLAISDGEVCDFTRVLEWGGSTLTAAVERVLNVSASEA